MLSEVNNFLLRSLCPARRGHAGAKHVECCRSLTVTGSSPLLIQCGLEADSASLLRATGLSDSEAFEPLWNAASSSGSVVT